MTSSRRMRPAAVASPALSVAEAKRRFSELIERVQRGERIQVARRGKPVLTLGPPSSVSVAGRKAPAGLATAVGALSDWPDLNDVVAEIYRSRKRARDRRPPDMG